MGLGVFLGSRTLVHNALVGDFDLVSRFNTMVRESSGSPGLMALVVC